MVSLIVLIFEIAILYVIKSIGVWDIGTVVATGMIAIFSVTFLIDIQTDDRFNKYTNQMVSSYFFRLALLYFDLFGNKIRTLPQSGADTLMFYNAAKNWALYGTKSSRGNFVYVMGGLFRFIGTNKLYAQFLIMLMSIASLLIFIKIIDSLAINNDSKDQSVWILCMLPNFALLSSIFLRESIVTFLVTSSVYCITKWIQGGSTKYSVGAIGLSLLSCLFHSGCIGITLGCFVCILVYDNYERRIHASVRGIVIAVIIAFGLAFIFINYGDALLGKFANVDSMKDIANTNQIAESSYAQYVGNSNNPVNMLIFTIPRIVYFLFSPFPWQWRGMGDIIAFFFSGLFYLVTIKNAIEYLRSKKQLNSEIIICMLIVAFFCTFIFAWGVSNTGTASRHRDKMVCLYGIIYALSTNINSLKQEDKYSEFKSQGVDAEKSSYFNTNGTSI